MIAEPFVVWATAPLLDPANVGRSVWASFNGNTPTRATIAKLTRSHVHIEGDRAPYRVDKAGDYAICSGRWTSSVFTEQRRTESDERRTMTVRLNRVAWSQYPTGTLRQIVALLDGGGEPA